MTITSQQVTNDSSSRPIVADRVVLRRGEGLSKSMRGQLVEYGINLTLCEGEVMFLQLGNGPG